METTSYEILRTKPSILAQLPFACQLENIKVYQSS